MKELSLEEIHGSQLETMVILRDFCEKHHLKYYLAYGTLLGAVRHRGFIPWDDDVDIFMPREDYEYLLRHFNEDASRSRELISKESCPAFYQHFAKIIDRNTAVTEKGQTLEIGVWVDIFPMDYVSDNRILCAGANLSIGFLNLLRPYVSIKPRKGRAAYKEFILRIFRELFPSEEYLLKRRQKWIDSIVSAKKSHTYALLYQSFAIYGMPLAPVSMFEPSVKMDFEGELFDAPRRYGNVLTCFYGRNYMTMPEPDMRQGHSCLSRHWRETEDRQIPKAEEE